MFNSTATTNYLSYFSVREFIPHSAMVKDFATHLLAFSVAFALPYP